MQVAVNAARALTVVTRVWRTLARPVMLRGSALAIAVGIPAFVLSAGNGLRASDVIAWSHHSALVRLLLWCGWLVLSAPALRLVFVAPGSLSLRALRLPRAPLLLTLFTLGAAVEAPWVVLFARGAGALAACSALTGAVCLGALSVSAWARPRGRLLAFAALAALLIAWDPPAWLLLSASTLALPFALMTALRNAHERPPLRFKLTRPGSALLAVYLVHLLRLLRRERSRLVSALSAAVAGSAGVLLSLRNDPSERPVQRALVVMALPLTVAAAVSVAPLLESERRLQVLLRSLRTKRSTVIAAFFIAAATPSSALAAASGVAVSAGAGLGAGALCGALLSWACALAGAVALWGRGLERRAQRGSGTFVAGVALIAILAIAGAYTW